MDVQIIEAELQDLSDQLTAPGPQECLYCYLERMLGLFGCARHRFTRRWARGRLRGTEDGLVRWASSLGGCCCDCEVVMNTLRRPSAVRRGGALCTAAAQAYRQESDGPVTCSGVAGSRGFRPA